MKNRRIILVVVIIATVLIGWIISIRSITGIEDKKKQEKLIQEADMYLQDELFIRAIPIYKEALQFQSSLNNSIEENLLQAYYGYGASNEYIDLALSRIEKGTANEQEYINVAEYYTETYKYEEAMSLIKSGIEKMQSDILKNYYEENRYEYQIFTTVFDEMIPTEDSDYMPVRYGDKWGYIDDVGYLITDCLYDFATPYNTEGYAVIKENGKFYLIVHNGDKYSIDKNNVEDVYRMSQNHILAKKDDLFSYYDYDFNNVAPTHQYDQITVNACGVAAVKKDNKWGIITDSGKRITDFIYDDIAVNSLGTVFCNNVGMVRLDNLWYLIDTDGNKISEQGFFDAKAPESVEYIAVKNENGKWGFITSEGNLIIDYQYSDAKSFSDGLAAIYHGDTWGYISKQNKLVIDQEFTDANPFHNGTAQASFIDGKILVKIKYRE